MQPGVAAAVADSEALVAGDCALSDSAAIADAAVGDNSEMPNDESRQDTVDAAVGGAPRVNQCHRAGG